MPVLAIDKNELKIGESFKRFRKELGLTQQQVADGIGVFAEVYRKYELGKNIPSAAVVVALAKQYGVSTDYLLGLSDIPTPARTVDEVTQAAITFANVLKKNFAQQTTEGTGDHEIKTDAPARL